MKKDLRNKILATAAGVTLFTTMALGHNTPWGIFGGSGDSGKVTTYQYATADDLGSANSFAVVAETYNKDNHMEGTFAAAKVNAKSDICGITNNVKPYINSNENLIYIADIDNIANLQTNNGVDTDLLVLPEGTVLDYSYNNGNGVSITYNGKTATYNNLSSMNVKEITTTDKSDYKIDFNKALSSLSTYANARLAENTAGSKTEVVKDEAGGDMNNRKYVVNCGAGKNVISVPVSDLENYKFEINGPSDGEFSLVINVTGAGNGTYNFNKKISVNGQDDSHAACGGQVLFNFGNAAGTFEFQETSLGVILAPNGNVKCLATHNGSVFAKTVSNEGCEIHQKPFKQFVEVQEETTTEETTTEETTTEEITTEETTTEEITTEETTTEEITTEEPTTEEVIIETEATTEETTTEEITTEETTTEEITTEETTTEEITTEEPTTEEVIIETEATTEETTTEEITTEETTTEAPTQDVVIETEATTEETTTEAPTQDVVVETEETTTVEATTEATTEAIEETEEETDIVLDEERESEEEEDETEVEVEEQTTNIVSDSTPQTGDNANIPLMATVCVLSLAGVIVLKKVKKEN